jgi:hypothetical protein
MSKKMTSLKLIPLAYLDTVESEELVKKVTERGKKWVRYCKGKPITKFYRGPAIPYVKNRSLPMSWSSPSHPEEEFVSTRRVPFVYIPMLILLAFVPCYYRPTIGVQSKTLRQFEDL